MPERSHDWLRQAEKDLLHAKNSLQSSDYEWCCFAAQQAAEKALKAVYENNNKSVKGHSILGLIDGLTKDFQVPEKFYNYARVLSRYYIETRYANGFPEGAPTDYFDKILAKEAIDDSEKILIWCRNIIIGNK